MLLVCSLKSDENKNRHLELLALAALQAGGSWVVFETSVGNGFWTLGFGGEDGMEEGEEICLQQGPCGY